jgi:hypothetical protein
MTQKDLLQMHFDVLNLQVGDQVQITHKVPNEYLGVDYLWSVDMSRHIGSIYKVTEVVDDHIRLDGSASSWSWHPACMKVMYRKPKDVTITFGLEEDGINPEYVAKLNAETVNVFRNEGSDLLCSLDFDTVELIFKHMNKLSGKMLLTRGEE